jgi:hypothetical protein
VVVIDVTGLYCWGVRGYDSSQACLQDAAAVSKGGRRSDGRQKKLNPSVTNRACQSKRLLVGNALDQHSILHYSFRLKPINCVPES